MPILRLPRILFAAAFHSVLALVLLAPATAKATPITYNLALTPNAGSLYGGTGSFTIETPPAASGISDYKVGAGLDSLKIQIDSQTFTLAMGPANTLVRFLNGKLNDITYAANTGTSPMRFSFQSTAGYVFYYNNLQSTSTGTFTATLAPAAVTPEPSSIALLGTGLLSLAGVCKRRFFPGPPLDTPSILKV